MKRTIGSVVLALVLAGAVAGLAQAATLVVDDDGGQCTAGFTTIQDAVNAAAPGDTIRVCAGEYFEEVTIDDTKTNVKLIGVGLAELKAPLLGISPAGFLVAADGVQIDNFRISGFGGCGILMNGDRALIQGNEVHHNRSNICLQFSDDSRVRNNIVFGAVFNGIGTTDGSGNEISGNRVTGGGDVGIFVGGDTDSVVHHNVVVGAEGLGIEVAFSGGTAVRNNTVRLSFDGGVVVFASGSVDVESNSVQLNGFVGIAVDDCVGCTVSRNSVNFNNLRGSVDGGGILLAESDGTTVTQNSAHRNVGTDCIWDALGTNTFVRNACGTEVPPGAWD